ncbi:MAG: hypothetical protein KC583_02590, partial [Myxococcales bacterium]|nr:hypothetical protein [Myxococcales bacterium]
MALREQTGLPLLIAVNMDGEVFNERFAGDVYHDPKFIESTRGYVCVVASPERHTERDYDALGNRVECPRFGGCTCSEHIDIEPELFRRWFDGKRNAPRHVGVDQDGKVLFDRFLDQSMQTAIDAIQKHRGTPPDSLAASDDVAALLARRDALARELLEARYRKADKASRSKLLDAAGAAKNEPFDLLRMGLFDTDPELARHAALALALRSWPTETPLPPRQALLIDTLEAMDPPGLPYAFVVIANDPAIGPEGDFDAALALLEDLVGRDDPPAADALGGRLLAINQFARALKHHHTAERADRLFGLMPPAGRIPPPLWERLDMVLVAFVAHAADRVQHYLLDWLAAHADALGEKTWPIADTLPRVWSRIEERAWLIEAAASSNVALRPIAIKCLMEPGRMLHAAPSAGPPA